MGLRHTFDRRKLNMRYYTQKHAHYCGIDLHARNLYVCILDSHGNIVVHKNIKANPEALLKTIQPYREDLVIGVECMFSWYWVADFCEDQGIEFVLGHALYMKAIHGGKAKNDRIDSEKIARLLASAMFPVAYVYPRPWRSTRDLMRRRIRLMRQRAELMAHIHNTLSQYNLPPNTDNLAYDNIWVPDAMLIPAGVIAGEGLLLEISMHSPSGGAGYRRLAASVVTLGMAANLFPNPGVDTALVSAVTRLVASAVGYSDKQGFVFASGLVTFLVGVCYQCYMTFEAEPKGPVRGALVVPGITVPAILWGDRRRSGRNRRRPKWQRRRRSGRCHILSCCRQSPGSGMRPLE